MTHMPLYACRTVAFGLKPKALLHRSQAGVGPHHLPVGQSSRAWHNTVVRDAVTIWSQ